MSLDARRCQTPSRVNPSSCQKGVNPSTGPFPPLVAGTVNGMGRPLRVWVEGATYHLFSRGSDRHPIFDEYRDYARFAALHRRYSDELKVDCFAWALMPNHWHLLVRAPSHGLSDFVKRLNHRYSLRTNLRHERTAHLFKNRFGSVLQESERQFLWTLRYVLRNPVEAGICSSVQQWRWSSYHDTVRAGYTPAFLCVDEVLGYFGTTPERQIVAFNAFLAESKS
jgi:putative transposase